MIAEQAAYAGINPDFIEHNRVIVLVLQLGIGQLIVAAEFITTIEILTVVS